MSDFAIQVENIGKVFRIYDKPSDRLRETFSFARKQYHADFKALNNISFNVKKGGFLGIVGRNGAGKSTLLKILSGELTPSEGTVSIKGNISLLQLGVGFDTELTGMENARFASKLLGYSNREIEAMMKDIIEFADIGDFIFHPVKTYSSGMYSRLSFAVGVNINPDILIADEVLAVGDLRFSQKCLRKMREFKENGKTIVLVTHDTSTVNVFCDTAIWLMDGELFQSGDAQYVAKNYTNYMLYDKLPADYIRLAREDSKNVGSRPDGSMAGAASSVIYDVLPWQDMSQFTAIGDGRAEITRMAFIELPSQEAIRTVQGYESVALVLDVVFKGFVQTPQVGLRINSRQGLTAAHTNNDICGTALAPKSPGDRFIITFRLKLPSMANGQYTISIGVQDNSEMPQLIEDVYEFKVQRNDIKFAQCGYVIIESEEVLIDYL